MGIFRESAPRPEGIVVTGAVAMVVVAAVVEVLVVVATVVVVAAAVMDEEMAEECAEALSTWPVFTVQRRTVLTVPFISRSGPVVTVTDAHASTTNQYSVKRCLFRICT